MPARDYPTNRCTQCKGELIGTEIPQRTCGDCGGRSIHPRTS